MACSFTSQCCVLTCTCFLPTDTDYISEEEKQKVELMLAFLTEESKQAAASTAVSTNACVIEHQHIFLIPMLLLQLPYLKV